MLSTILHFSNKYLNCKERLEVKENTLRLCLVNWSVKPLWEAAKRSLRELTRSAHLFFAKANAFRRWQIRLSARSRLSFSLSPLSTWLFKRRKRVQICGAFNLLARTASRGRIYLHRRGASERTGALRSRLAHSLINGVCVCMFTAHCLFTCSHGLNQFRQQIINPSAGIIFASAHNQTWPINLI